MNEESDVVTIQFHAQADGRKVSRLSGGKVVLVDLAFVDQVQDGDWWLVRLRHKETFAIAEPVEKRKAPPGVTLPVPPQTAPTLAPASPASATALTTQVSANVALAPKSAPKPASKSTAFEVQGMMIEPNDIVRGSDRVAIFVDGANMDYAFREAGYFADFRKVRDFFVGKGTFYAGFYYVADVTATDPIQTRFLDFLSYSGYIVRRKPVKVITDHETGERSFKANLDTEIVLDMVNTVSNYDVAFLFSGDSDFERAVDLLRSRGKRVYVVSSRRTLSRELSYISDKPVFLLEDFRSLLARDEKPA
ncbi:MAG: NYN domain-containing protein [Candidatus Thermoplasmatota archaeon]